MYTKSSLIVLNDCYVNNITVITPDYQFYNKI